MSDSEKLELEEAVAWRLMGNDATYEQAKWRDQVALRSHSTSLLERRIRMSLGSGDRQGWQPGWLVSRRRRKIKMSGVIGVHRCCWNKEKKRKVRQYCVA